MLTSSRQIHSLDDLRNYVYETICDHHELAVGAFQMTERILVRGTAACGIYFCVHGPRAVKMTAIWETDRNTILFYDPSGERFHRTQLMAAPQLVHAAA